MKHIVSFSGGMGSFAEAYSCCELYGKNNVELLFADTKMEDEDLYRFLEEAVAFLGCELITVSDGRTPFEVFKDEKFMGNSRYDPCSKLLKRQLLTKYIKEKYKPENVNVHLGIDYSEVHRLGPVKERSKPYIYRSTLVEQGIIIHKDYSEQFGIRRPRLYNWGLGHNDCGGFCPKAGLGHYNALFKANRERYLLFEQQEQEVYEAIGKTHAFLKKQVKGVKSYLTLRQLREQYLEPETLTTGETIEYGGCGCALGE